MRIGLDISVLNDKQKTGIGVYTYNLINALLKINQQDQFILFGIATIDTFDYLKNLHFKNYPNVEMKIYKMPAGFFRTAFLFWQKFNWPPIECFTGKLDIFHSFNWNLPPQTKGRTVATVFDMTPKLFPKFHQQRTIQLDQIRMDRIKKFANLVITISENSKKDFLEYAPQKKVEVIHPGIGENFLKKMDKSKVWSILRKYNLDSGYILSVGTLEPRKNIKFLINTYLKSNFQRKLVLAGIKGWENSDLFELINQNQDKIKSLGFIPDEDLAYIYSQAVCLVYPSFYEGFGLPVLEALSTKTPVICSKNSALEEVGGDAVYYINPKNEKSLIKALLKVTSNETLRRELIFKGLKQVEKFSWKQSAKKLNQLYQQL